MKYMMLICSKCSHNAMGKSLPEFHEHTEDEFGVITCSNCGYKQIWIPTNEEETEHYLEEYDEKILR